MARILLIGGGARGRELAARLRDAGHVVRITTRDESGRAAIEAVGAECWVGTPDRLATLRRALDGVAVACWLLGTACGGAEELSELHGSRLAFFGTQTIDTTIRGLVYEAAGSVSPAVLDVGRETIAEVAERNSIPLEILSADPGERERWLEAASHAIDALLGL
jgi:hypothetical protein